MICTKPTIWGRGAFASMVECVLTWIREQHLVVCNIAKWTILCIVVHFQPVIKLLQKGVRVQHRRVILMQKCKIFLGRGHNPSHSEILPTILHARNLHYENETSLHTWFDCNFDAGGSRAADDVRGRATVDARVCKLDITYRQRWQSPATNTHTQWRTFYRLTIFIIIIPDG